MPTASDDVKTDFEASRTNILDWCLTNQFELVQCDDDDQEEDEFDEREGKDRILSALKAHTWSNLELGQRCEWDSRDRIHNHFSKNLYFGFMKGVGVEGLDQ